MSELAGMGLLAVGQDFRDFVCCVIYNICDCKSLKTENSHNFIASILLVTILFTFLKELQTTFQKFATRSFTMRHELWRFFILMHVIILKKNFILLLMMCYYFLIFIFNLIENLLYIDICIEITVRQNMFMNFQGSFDLP